MNIMSSKQSGSLAKKRTRGQIKELESKDVGSKVKMAKVKPDKQVKEKSVKIKVSKRETRQTKEP